MLLGSTLAGQTLLPTARVDVTAVPRPTLFRSVFGPSRAAMANGWLAERPSPYGPSTDQHLGRGIAELWNAKEALEPIDQALAEKRDTFSRAKNLARRQLAPASRRPEICREDDEDSIDRLLRLCDASQTKEGPRLVSHGLPSLLAHKLPHSFWDVESQANRGHHGLHSSGGADDSCTHSFSWCSTCAPENSANSRELKTGFSPSIERQKRSFNETNERVSKQNSSYPRFLSDLGPK